MVKADERAYMDYHRLSTRYRFNRGTRLLKMIVGLYSLVNQYLNVMAVVALGQNALIS